MKVLYIGDNRNRGSNWGCRATSKALKDLISRGNNVFYTIYGDVIARHIFYFESKKGVFVNRGGRTDKIIKLSVQLFSKFLSVKRLQKFTDFTDENVDKSMKKFIKKAKYNFLYKEMLEKAKECDAVILNGEGSFIFSTPHRRDTIFYLMILKTAQQMNKKNYLVNAMFSDCHKSNRNVNVLKQATDIMSKCTLVVARDMDSYNYINQFDHSINLKYVPDALFSWTKYENYIYNLLQFPTALIPSPEYDKYWDNFDFTQPYICISGSSSAAWNQKDARLGYIELVQSLKEYNYKLFIVPTCGGDRFLYEVADQTNIPVIPVNTNILAGMAILANAAVFISGRWHPSILASLGGTPCIIFGSNSHKTISFLNMMDYDKKREYNAIPDKKEIPFILNDIQDYIQQGIILRNKIKRKAKELSELTDFYKNIQ